MRALLVLALMLIASPALAQFWGHHENARFGYAIDVPPDFVGQGESDNGDGQAFLRLGAEQVLTVWGGHLLDTFEEEAAERIASASAENWGVSYQASTPQWAMFSGQRDHRIVIAGPTTLAALLNSLQMGFRTLAIEKRSSEVRVLLGAVKTEFGKFATVLEKANSQLDTVQNSIKQAGVRTRAIERQLRGVEALPGEESQKLLGGDEAE